MVDETEDIVLAAKLSEGCRDSFRAIYEKYNPILYSLSLKMLKDPVMAANTVQEVFVTLWEKRRIIVVSTSLRNYLYSAAKHNILNYIRNRNTELRNYYDYVQLLGDSDDSVHAELENKEQMKILDNAISSLPKQQNSVLRLKIEGYSNSQIADRMKISVFTVKYHYSEGLKTLRKLLALVIIFLSVI